MNARAADGTSATRYLTRLVISGRYLADVGELLLQPLPFYPGSLFSQCPARSFEVDFVLQSLQQLKVRERNERGDILSMPLEHNALTPERNLIEDIRELLPGFAGGYAGQINLHWERVGGEKRVCIK